MNALYRAILFDLEGVLVREGALEELFDPRAARFAFQQEE